MLDLLVSHLGKCRHQRGFLREVHKSDESPPAGCVQAPTYYLEDRKSGVNLKCYARQEKLAGGGFGKPVVRIEWTLRGKVALERHLGGNQISDLLTANLNSFVRKNLRLERVDHVAIGKLFHGKAHRCSTRLGQPLMRQYNDPNYRARRAAFLVLRGLAYRELSKFSDWDQALFVCQH
jgi:hypothetical protein